MLTVEFTVLGIPCLGLNGGPMFKHSEAFSFQVATEDQAETDRYWNAIVGNGGQESDVRLVQGQMGTVLADHADRPDARRHRSRSRRRQARVRRDDDDAEDRRRRHRGGAPRLKLGPGAEAPGSFPGLLPIRSDASNTPMLPRLTALAESEKVSTPIEDD